MLSIEMFLAWRSTCATNVRCNPASRARASCDQSRSPRNRIKLSASVSLAEGAGRRMIVVARDKARQSPKMSLLSQPPLRHIQSHVDSHSPE